MRLTIIGAGPSGLVAGIALARAGHEVDLIDRDPGPDPVGRWKRKGVMQFHHAHAFRPQVAQVLRALVPDAYQQWVDEGAEPRLVTASDGGTAIAGVRSLRETLDRALHRVACAEPRLRRHVGHVDRLRVSRGRVCGVGVGGLTHDADLVIDASGRAARVRAQLPARSSVGGPCAIAYADRRYVLNDPSTLGELANPIAWHGDLAGWQAMVFAHQRAMFSVLVLRPSPDRRFTALRHPGVFEAVCAAVPALARWTHPELSTPVSEVLPGGTLSNVYRSQRDPTGAVTPGLISVGDAVATTTPTYGRGIALALMQVQALAARVDEHGADLVALVEDFDEWCHRQIRPWVDDHIAIDAATRARWAGAPLEPTTRLPSDLIVAAGAIDPVIERATFGYRAMTRLPDSLDSVEPLARAHYAAGWRPPRAEGPGIDDLAQIVAEAEPDG